jgi:hypothetical protein
MPDECPIGCEAAFNFRPVDPARPTPFWTWGLTMSATRRDWESKVESLKSRSADKMVCDFRMVLRL